MARWNAGSILASSRSTFLTASVVASRLAIASGLPTASCVDRRRDDTCREGTCQWDRDPQITGSAIRMSWRERGKPRPRALVHGLREPREGGKLARSLEA